MADKVSIEQKIQQYRQANPQLKDLSDKQILSVMVENGHITLTEEQKNSIYSNTQNNIDNTGLTIQKQTKSQIINLKSGRKIVIQDGTTKYYAADGVELKKDYFEKQEGQIDVKPSGRYSIIKAGKTNYYAADGTELNEKYFKQVESADVKIKGYDGKTYNLNNTIANRIHNVGVHLKKAENSNGFIGSTWNGFKNLTGIGDSSDKVREQQETEKKLLQQFNTNEQKRPEIFKQLTGTDYTPDNLEKFIKGEIKLKSEIALQSYTEGQDMATDVGADIISGIAAVGIYTAAVAAAPFSGGASIAVGIAAAGTSAAAIKAGLKATDAVTGGREYTLKDAGHDAATGAFSGVLAPVTGGLGGAVGKTVATKLGIQAVKQVGKEVAEEAAVSGVKQTIKTALTNPTGYEYVGGNVAKRGLAFAAETATDGAVGGAVDNAFRTAYDGGSLEDIGNSAVQGFVGGAIMSPVIGGGMKAAGKGVQKVFGKDNVHIDADGNRVKVNEDGTVVKIDENGNEIPANATDTEINIPEGKFAAPLPTFLETDDAFREIVRKRATNIIELDKIQDIDEFCSKSFQIIKEEMGIADSPIELKITDDVNQYDLESNTVSINRNWANGDRAELFGAIAHELNHFLQWKEVILNYDQDSDYWIAIVNQLQKSERGQANIEYISNKYPDNLELQEFFNKAKAYEENWQKYVAPEDPQTGMVDVNSDRYHQYKNQTVEKESFRRGEIVAEEYRNILNVSDINSRLATASSREEFVTIRDEIKAMPNSSEKQTLQQEYLKKYNEVSRKFNEEFDIRMEYRQEDVSKNNFDEIFDKEFHDEYTKKIIDYWTKTSGSEEVILNINGIEHKVLSFKSQAKNANDGFNIVKYDTLYRMEPIKRVEEFSNLQIANELYSLLGFKTKNIQLAETSEGLYVMSETFSIKGGFSNNDPDLLAKIYGINILLGNDLNFSASCSKLDKNKTPVITRPSLNTRNLLILSNLFKNAPATKDEVIMSLQKAVDLSDDMIIEIVKKNNSEASEQIIQVLLDRKRFISKFLEKVKNNEQDGLPIKEYLENIYHETWLEERYFKLQQTTDTSFMSFLQEKFNFTTKEILAFEKLNNVPELAGHLKTKIVKGEIGKEELIAFTNRIIGERAFDTFLKETPENKIKITEILFDLYKNHNIEFSNSYLLVLTLAQSKISGKAIDMKAVNCIKELTQAFGNKQLPDNLYHAFIKDGKIIPNALSVIELFKKYNFETEDIYILTKQLLEEGGSISLPKLEKLEEILIAGETAGDATAIFTAINTPNGFNDKLYPYISKLKSIGANNTDIAEIISSIRKSFSNVENGKVVQREHALTIAMKFADKEINIKDLKVAINELALFDPSIETQISTALERNNNIDLKELISFLKSTHPRMQKFDVNAYLLGFHLLREGIPSKDLDKLIQITRVANDSSSPQTKEIRNFIEEQLLEKHKTVDEIIKLLMHVNKKIGFDRFAFELLKDNIGKLSDQELINVIYYSTIQTKANSEISLDDIYDQRFLISDFMINLLNKNYEINDVYKIISGALNKEHSLTSMFVTGVDKELLSFVEKMVDCDCAPDDIYKLTTNLKINQNLLNLVPDKLKDKNKMVQDWISELIFEKDFSTKTATDLLNVVGMRNNMTRTIYDFDEKVLSLLNDFIERGIIKKDFHGNLSTIITAFRLLDYDKNAIKIVEKYLQEPIILQNGKLYDIDAESLGMFVIASKNKETGIFDINKFNENVQLYILQADYGFSLKEMQILAKLYKNEIALEQIPTGTKVNLLIKLSYASKEAIKLIEEKVIDIKGPDGNVVFGNIDNIISKLLSDINLASKNIRTTQKQRLKFLQSFISNKERNPKTGLNPIETKLSNFDFTKYGKEGLPLKYNRETFIENMREILADLTPEEQASVLKFHNIDMGENGFNNNPRIKKLVDGVEKSTNDEYKSIIAELSIILEGLNENNLQLYKENNIENILKKCIQLSMLDESSMIDILKDNPELNLEKIFLLKEKAVKFAEIELNNDVSSLPVPLIVKNANDEIESYSQFSHKMMEASKKIEKEYNKFIYENEFLTEDTELNEILNGIMRGLPDIMLTVGKKQHKTHNYSVDIHTMEVLKKAINNPEYKNLSDADRTILKFSILLHDFGKKFINLDTPDTGHEIDSAEIANGILAQFNLPKSVKERILNLIKYHDWFAKYNKNEWDANKIAALFRSPDDYKIAKIMSKADLASINEAFNYKVLNINEDRTPENYSIVFDNKLKNIDIAYEKMYGKTNILMNSRILNTQKIPLDKQYGVRILNLADDSIALDMDLGQYGLNGTTKKDLRLTVHMVAEDNLLGNLESAKLGMEKTINDNNVWSISMIKMDRTRTYMCRDYGFLTDTPISSIAIASPNNISSGYEKGVNKFVELLFANNPHRNYLKQNFIQSMQSQGININEKDYQELSRLIYNKKFLTQLETTPEIEINGKRFLSAVIVQAIQKSTDALFTGKTHTELVTINPQIQGLVARKNSMDEVAPDFITFAKKYNLPILLVGNK